MPEGAPETGNVTGTSAAETVYAPAGHTSVAGNGGGDLLVGNMGDQRFWMTDPRDRISDPGGTDTQIGWMSLTLQPGIENLVVHGDFNFAIGNELDNLIVVDGSQWVDGGLGNDVLVGSKDQRTTFVARTGGGNDVIYSWNDNSQIHFTDFGFKTPADVRAAMTQQGGDVVIRLSPAETLTVRDVTSASFVDRQFLLPLDTSKLGGLTFQDSFDSLQTFDPNTGTGQWRTNYGGNLKDAWAYTIPANGEQQAYVQPGFYGQGSKDLGVNPFSIADGVLSITAAPSPDAYASYFRPYTSGMLNTLGTFSQQYGYFEARVATPNVAGAWPAFWMVPSPYVPNVEADIFEALGATPNVDYRRAWGGVGGAGTQYDNAYKTDPGGFHTYGMLWTSTATTFYLDGVAVMTGPTPSTWTQPMSMILNLAVGGWGGNPDPALYPAQMKVDYVRAYALSDGSSQVVVNAPELPVATLRSDGPAFGQTAVSPLLAANGAPVSIGHIVVGASQPASTPPPYTFVVWEDGGAVFGAVSDGGGLSKATTLLAGSASQFTGAGTWLTSGKVVTAYFADDGAGGKHLWSLVFDPSDSSWARQDLGAASATGAVTFVATAAGGFAVSWHNPDGSVAARGYDEYAYGGDIPGWYGPVRAISGDLIGVNAQGQLIAANGGGQELFHLAGATTTPPAALAHADAADPTAGQAPAADLALAPQAPAAETPAAGDPHAAILAPGDTLDFSGLAASASTTTAAAPSHDFDAFAPQGDAFDTAHVQAVALDAYDPHQSTDAWVSHFDSLGVAHGGQSATEFMF